MSGWYVYGIADAERAVESGEVKLVRDRELAAVVAAVDLGEYGEEQLPERLNDRPWLEEKVLAHEEVLSRFLRDGPVVPLRFGAIYRRLEDVVQLLDSRHGELTEDLERVRGRVELGVKGWADRDRLRQESTAVEASTPGRAYLQRKQAERDEAARSSERLGEIARAAHARLTELAVDSVANRPQPRELNGRPEQMFLNAAYLVPSGDEALPREVERLTAEHADFGLTFEVTGPWPPYNFVGRREEEA